MGKNGKEFSVKLESVLVSDNVGGFARLLKKEPEEITKSLVNKCAEYGAKKCLLALLNGELCDPPPALDSQLPETGVSALAYVAYSCPDPQIIALLLKRCNAIPLVNLNCTIGLIDGLPIHFVLVRLSYLEHLYSWGQGESLIKLVILLCQWKTKPILDCARLLAQYTDSINEVAWTFVKYGGLKQFVALLLVAREQVMAPFNTGFTLCQYLASEINSYLNSYSEYDSGHEDNVHIAIAHNGLLNMLDNDYLHMLMDAQKILAVFDKAGDALSLYCSSMKKNVPVGVAVADICKLLKEAKICILSEDLYFDNNFPDRPKSLGPRRLGKLRGPNPYYDRSSNFKMVVPSGNLTRPYDGSYPNVTNIPVPKDIVSVSPPQIQARFISTTACQVRKISKPLEHAHANPHPLLKHLAFMTVKLKKGLRFL